MAENSLHIYNHQHPKVFRYEEPPRLREALLKNIWVRYSCELRSSSMMNFAANGSTCLRFDC